jgi:hypothetical protein
MRRPDITVLQILAGAIIFLAGCGTREVQLLPAARDGIFYTSFAEAVQIARANDKHILLELWRPG